MSVIIQHDHQQYGGESKELSVWELPGGGWGFTPPPSSRLHSHFWAKSVLTFNPCAEFQTLHLTLSPSSFKAATNKAN